MNPVRTMPLVHAVDTGVPAYHVTHKGESCLDQMRCQTEKITMLSPYLYDALMMCGTGMNLAQLHQFMPPESLAQSLQSLMALGLIDQRS